MRAVNGQHSPPKTISLISEASAGLGVTLERASSPSAAAAAGKSRLRVRLDAEAAAATTQSRRESRRQLAAAAADPKVKQVLDGVDQARAAAELAPRQPPAARRGAGRLRRGRDDAKMAGSPLLAAAGAGGGPVPGFADTTDWSRPEFNETAVSIMRARERDAAAPPCGRRKSQPPLQETLPLLSSTAQHPPQEQATPKRKRPRPVDAEGSGRPPAQRQSESGVGDSHYMLAGSCAIGYMPYTRTRSKSEPLRMNPEAEDPAGLGASDAALDPRWVFSEHGSPSGPPEAPPLPTVGAWRQTWLYRAPPLERLQRGIQNLDVRLKSQKAELTHLDQPPPPAHAPAPNAIHLS